MTGAPRLRLALAYAAICVIWGSTYLAIKVGLESFSPLFYARVRYTLAAALAFAVARWQGVSLRGPVARWLPPAGIGVLLIRSRPVWPRLATGRFQGPSSGLTCPIGGSGLANA